MNLMKSEYICISCIGENSIKFIEESTDTLIKTIKVANRPFDIRKSIENKLYIACDRSEQVEIIDLITLKKDSFKVSNNGVLDIDNEKSFMYISDGANITVYDLKNRLKVASVSGGMGIEYIYVERKGIRLFVMDFLLNHLNIYNKTNLELITSIKNLGVRPRGVLISEECEYAYIANEGIGNKGMGSGITIVDLRNNIAKLLEFPMGSAITSLAYKGNMLYAANRGLKRIEVINTITMKIFKSVETNGNIPELVEMNQNKTKLYIVEKDSNGGIILDIFDIRNSVYNKSIFIGSDNIYPKCIISVSVEQGYLSKDFVCLSKESKYDIKPMSVLVKRIFASYKQKICIPEIICKIPNNTSDFIFENIIFKSAFIKEGSLEKNSIDGRKNHFRVRFTLNIPYSVLLKSINNSICSIDGYVEEKKDLVMYMPEIGDDYEILAKSKGELLSSPNVNKNLVKFDAGFFILLRVLGEQEVQIPVLNCDLKFMDCEEYIAPDEEELYEAFINFNDTPFPLNSFSIPLEDID